MKRWAKEILTDQYGRPDLGSITAAFAILVLCALNAYDVVVQGAAFDAKSFGIGVGGISAGYAGYLFGDAKRPPPQPPEGGVQVNVERPA